MYKVVYNHMLSAMPSACCQEQSWHLAPDFYPLWASRHMKCSLGNEHTKCKLCFELLSCNLTWIMYLELQINFPILGGGGKGGTRQPAKSTLQILSKVTVHHGSTCIVLGFLFCLCIVILNFPYSLSEIYFWINASYSSSPTSIRIAYHNKPKVHII